MKLLFTGDINFRGKGRLTFDESKVILKEVQPYIESVDFVVPNLECPLADRKKHKPIKKSGPNHIYDQENITFLKAMNTYAVTIANNHIGDYGEGAIKDTFDLLRDNDIFYAGAGENIGEAYKALHIEKEGICVSVISVCENEFGIATETEYGSAGYNPRRLLKQIKTEKSVSDYVIVVFHGGNEFNPLPSPDTVDRYRLVCDMGADAVVGGHTHCPQGYEIYNGKPIVYSMGNFLFQSSSQKDENDSWYYGYMSILEIHNGISLKIVPYKFNDKADNIKIFEGNDKRKMLEYIDNLCKIIQNSEELDKYFKGWAWYHQWCPELPKDSGGTIKSYDESNLVHCEAHLSQLKCILKIYQNADEKEAEKYSNMIIELSKMPV